MTKQEAYVLRSVASGLAWQSIVKILNDCVELENKAALSSKGEDARDGVMRAQGARRVVDNFIRAAEAAQGEAE